MLPLPEFLSFIDTHKLFNAEDSVLLAVSGGKDSVLMAHLFKKAKFTFGIAHCNFNLRGAESDEDEAFVRGLAKHFNCSFFSTQFNTAAYAKSSGQSIQMAARELRYQWFEEIASKNAYQQVALAHHQNDSVETILLNLVRGTGIAGLHGISAKRELFVRPLLFLTREQIDQLVDDCDLEFREDASNSSTKYARNKIRLEIIPRLKEINPNLEATFVNNSSRFAELEEFLHSEVHSLRESLFRYTPGGRIKIELTRIKSLHPRKLLLYELFKPFNFTESILEDLSEAWDGQAGKIFSSASHTILIDREQLIVIPKQESVAEEISIYAGQEECMYEGMRLTIRLSNKAPIFADNNKVYLDEERLQFPLKIRPWKEGDFFYPYGMNGKKKISDFFTSIKIPLSEKKYIPILENGNGDVIWIAGYRSDERYKIGPHTKKIIIFEKQTEDDT